MKNLLIITLLTFVSSIAQAQLNAGDIAFIQYNADGTDDFAFVTLVDIPASEVIFFTDNEENSLTGGEGTIEWTAPAGGVACGTIVTITTAPSATTGSVSETNDVNFASGGDAILAYQGSAGTPTHIAALSNDGGSWGGAADGNLPGGLTDGTDAVALVEIDNAIYNGTTTIGTRAALLSAINDPTNWGGSNTVNQTFVGSFTVTDCAVTTDITTGAITGAPFNVACGAGTNGTGSIAFTSTGTFNVGNTYTAQISDASGSFASPTDIGTLASTANSGSISISIPSTFNTGSGYLIRIIANDPATTGSNSSAFIITQTDPCGITTGAITTAPFSVACNAATTATGSIAFTSSGTFNGGNVYTAQLSDASGSFASPVNIGTLSSTANSGSISITIPASTETGSGYVIRVISSDPVYTGSNSSAFTINQTDPCTTLPGCVLGGGIYLSAVLVDPNGTNNYDTDSDGSADSDDEFFQLTNSSGSTIDVGGWTFFDDDLSWNFTFPTPTNIAAGGTLNVVYSFDGGLPPAGTIDNGLGGSGALNNGGDDYFISTGSEYCEFCYGSASCDGTLAPGGTDNGNFTLVEQDGCPTVWNSVTGMYEVDCLSSPLPVELIFFNAVNDGDRVLATWSTASERDNDYFRLEKGNGETGWQTVATVKGAGNTTETTSYQLIDENPIEGASFYRLTQTDLNGQSETFPLVAIQRFSDFKVYPNPAGATVHFSGESISGTTIVIQDNTGQTVTSLEVSKGQKEISFETLHLANGLYSVSLYKNGGNIAFKKLIIN